MKATGGTRIKERAEALSRGKGTIRTEKNDCVLWRSKETPDGFGGGRSRELSTTDGLTFSGTQKEKIIAVNNLARKWGKRSGDASRGERGKRFLFHDDERAIEGGRRRAEGGHYTTLLKNPA